MRAKHSKQFWLRDNIAVGIDRMQRNFGPRRRQAEAWCERQLPHEAAKFIICRAFVEGKHEVPKHLAQVVHSRYFDPRHEGLAPRTMWNLSDAFTSAFKELETIPQFRATARLGAFLEGVRVA